MACRTVLALVIVIAASGCSTNSTVESASAGATGPVPNMIAKRAVTEVDCSKPVDMNYAGNLRCKK